MLLAKLAPEGAKAGLSSIVAKGKRAITVKVNEVVGVAGFALPGNYVDVMVNTQDEEGERKGRDKDRLAFQDRARAHPGAGRARRRPAPTSTSPRS